MTDTKPNPPEVDAVLSLYAPQEQRVIQECFELSNRAANLTEFVGSSVFMGLPEEDRVLLTEQMAAMSRLQAILVKRINRFKPLFDEPTVPWCPPCGTDRGEVATPEPDFLAGVKACDLSGEGNCEACQ